jgi:hypothetical protein
MLPGSGPGSGSRLEWEQAEHILLIAAIGELLHEPLADGQVVPVRRVNALAEVAAHVWRGEPLIAVPVSLLEPLQERAAGLIGWTV